MVHNSMVCSAGTPERRVNFSFYKRSHLPCVCRAVAAINPPRPSTSSVYAIICFYISIIHIPTEILDGTQLHPQLPVN